MQTPPEVVQRDGDDVEKVLLVADDGRLHGVTQKTNVRLDQRSVSEEESLEQRNGAMTRIEGGGRGSLSRSLILHVDDDGEG